MSKSSLKEANFSHMDQLTNTTYGLVFGLSTRVNLFGQQKVLLFFSRLSTSPFWNLLVSDI